MTEPSTIGTMVSRILGMASEAALQDSARKDAYQALKRKLCCRAASDVDALERNPTSAARRAVIAEAVDQLPEAEKICVKMLAAELTEALGLSPAKGPVGIDVRKVETEGAKLEGIDSHNRTARAVPVRLTM